MQRLSELLKDRQEISSRAEPPGPFPRCSVCALKEGFLPLSRWWWAAPATQPGAPIDSGEATAHSSPTSNLHLFRLQVCPVVSVCFPDWRRKKTLQFSSSLTAVDLYMTSSIPQRRASEVCFGLHLFCSTSSFVGMHSEANWIRQAGSVSILK